MAGIIVIVIFIIIGAKQVGCQPIILLGERQNTIKFVFFHFQILMEMGIIMFFTVMKM